MRRADKRAGLFRHALSRVVQPRNPRYRDHSLLPPLPPVSLARTYGFGKARRFRRPLAPLGQSQAQLQTQNAAQPTADNRPGSSPLQLVPADPAFAKKPRMPQQTANESFILDISSDRHAEAAENKGAAAASDTASASVDVEGASGSPETDDELILDALSYWLEKKNRSQGGLLAKDLLGHGVQEKADVPLRSESCCAKMVVTRSFQNELPPSGDTSKIWEYIKAGVDRILNNPSDNLGNHAYINLYTAVYNFCTSLKNLSGGVYYTASDASHSAHGSPFGKHLYDLLKQNVSEYMKSVAERSQAHVGDDLLSFYNQEWT
ncbi:ubiquitin ligase (cullin) of SCF, partial [Coemansia sp. RSA 2599]